MRTQWKLPMMQFVFLPANWQNYGTHFIVYAEGHGYYISEYIGFCGFARFRGLKRSFDRLSAIDPFLVAKILNAIAVFTEHFFTAKQCHRGVTGHFHFAAAVLVLPILFFLGVRASAPF